MDLLNLQPQSQAKNMPVGLPSSPNENLRQIGQGVPEVGKEENKKEFNQSL